MSFTSLITSAKEEWPSLWSASIRIHDFNEQLLHFLTHYSMICIRNLYQIHCQAKVRNSDAETPNFFSQAFRHKLPHSLSFLPSSFPDLLPI
jgi:hypothetical protein